MIFIPPGVRRPINGGAVALGSPAFKPVVAHAIHPDAYGMAIELPFAMQAPVLLVQRGKWRLKAVFLQQFEFLIVRQGYVVTHLFLLLELEIWEPSLDVGVASPAGAGSCFRS